MAASPEVIRMALDATQAQLDDLATQGHDPGQVADFQARLDALKARNNQRETTR